MILQPVDPNERFRARRRRARKRLAMQRIGVVGVVGVVAGGIALGARSLGGGDPAVTQAQPAAAQPGQASAGPPTPRARPAEMRGVHVTMTLASIDGELDEYMALADEGLNTIQLDVKEENGEVGFRWPKVALAHEIGAAQPFYRARAVAEAVHARGLYLIGRVVVFEDPVLARARPDLAIQRSDGSAWTNQAGLGWANQYDRRVWKYNVDLAEAAIKAGFDEIMFDYVRFPTDGDLSDAVWPGKRAEPKARTIADFLEYAQGRLKPLGARVGAAVFGLAAARDMGIGQHPRLLARYVDTLYPMVYPSHYGPGEYGLDDPNGQPGRTVSLSLRDFEQKLRGRDAALIPWLQDFSLGREYTVDDVLIQIQAARNRTTGGFLLWNAGGVYTPGTLAPR
jgi:hypothetical protein